MDVLWISWQHLAEIAEQAREVAPDEACGFLLGRDNHVERVLPVENIADDPRHTYLVDPVVISRHLPDIVAFYHSHPASRPVPSQKDIDMAWQDGTPYLIVSLAEAQPKFAVWSFRYGEARSVELRTDVENRRYISPQSYAGEKLVIMVSALFAALFVLIVALNLLPPAPPIP